MRRFAGQRNSSSESFHGREGGCQRTLSRGMVGREKSMPFRTMGLGKSAQDMPFDRAFLGMRDFHNQLWDKRFAFLNFWDGTFLY